LGHYNEDNRFLYGKFGYNTKSLKYRCSEAKRPIFLVSEVLIVC